MITKHLICWCMVIITIARGREITYKLDEENDPDYILGNVFDDANLKELLTENDDPSTIRYSILFSGNTFAKLFKIDGVTSVLSTSQTLDRDSEELCRYNSICKLDFEVIAQSSQSNFFQKISVSVTVRDTNDNAPEFPTPTVDLNISEASVIGSSVPVAGAEDWDSGNNSLETYRIIPEGSPFSVTAEYYAYGRTQLQLIVTKKLDREIKENYKLTLIAEDGGTPSMTGSVILNIAVTDINDNAPLFEKNMYNISVAEDEAVNTVILRLKATDPDQGEKGRIIYRFSSHQSSDIQTFFKVNPTTGELTIIRSLIEERSPSYRIIVEASDNATKPLISQAVVFVSKLETHNTAPEITLNIISQKNFAEISENSPLGTVLALISVSDADTEQNGKVKCFINDDHFSLQKYDESDEYNIVLNRSLDREDNDIHLVIITCRDLGSPPLSATSNFTVHVTDTNDNPPVFTQSVYYAYVAENNDVGLSAIQVKAVDIDFVESENITYYISIENYFENWFSINRHNGIITVERQLDRENVSQILFKVLAEDNGEPSLTGSAIVEVTVTDKNDNKPEFIRSQFEFTVEENQPPNVSVGRMIVSDLDTGENGEVSISLVGQTGDVVPFTVFQNGSIFTNELLDRERVDVYHLIAIAVDKGVPALTSTANVTVVVKDLNDNTPIIKLPNDKPTFLAVSYQTFPNTVILTVDASDPDAGANSKLYFSLGGNVNVTNLFFINPFTGQLSIQKSLSVKDIGAYSFDICVQDNGSSPRMSCHLFTIEVSGDSSSGQKQSSDDSIRYYAIAIAIACVTIVLSALIILAIFLIRRRDKHSSDNSNGSVTSNSTLETDVSHNDMQINGVYTRDYIQDTLTKPAVKYKDKQVTFHHNVDTMDKKIPRMDTRQEQLSDDVTIWDWNETRTAPEQYHPQNSNTYTPFLNLRPLPNLYGKDQWNTDTDMEQDNSHA